MASSLNQFVIAQWAAVGSMPNYLAESSSVGSSKCLGMGELMATVSCPISDEESTKTTNVSKAIPLPHAEKLPVSQNQSSRHAFMYYVNVSGIIIYNGNASPPIGMFMVYVLHISCKTYK